MSAGDGWLFLCDDGGAVDLRDVSAIVAHRPLANAMPDQQVWTIAVVEE